MSASPAGPPGATPNSAPATNTPNGGAPTAVRRAKPKANPLVDPRRQRQRRIAQRAGTPAGAPNPPRPSSNGGELQTKYEEFKPNQSDVKGDFFKVVTTKRAMLEGLRFHVMKFQSKNDVDPTNQVEFTRPIRLHRRDAGAGKSGAGAGEVEEEENEEETKERARIEAQKEQRRRERESTQAQIAPKSKTKTITDNRKKIMQVYERNDTPEAIKASRLRYEETLPWHLEDFDNKNTWVGSYEAALSDTHIMFFKEAGVVDPQTGIKAEDKLRMVPVEKWYRFNAKDKATSLSLDEIEKQEKSGSTLTRWALHAQGADGPKKPKWMREKELEKEQKKRLEEMGMKSKLYLRSAGRGDEEAPRKRINDDDYFRSDAPDADVIDFDEQEHFADDEEGVNGLFEGEDEDTKAAQDRIKREQLSANFFANKDEKDVWEQEESEKMEKELARKLEKSLRKKIIKREKNYNYDLDDSEGNPYSTNSDSEDSEAERQKEEERKKEEERLAAEKGKLKPGESNATQPASGSSSKGSNTPSSQSKLGNTKLSMSSSQQNLKRAGSPNLSEASGNESARKKHKKNPGSGTDSEATDSGVKKMKRVHPITNTANRSRSGTPVGPSRPGSPVAGSVAGAPASRAASPGALAANQANALKSRPAAPAANLPPPTVEEIRAVIPAQGATMTQLISAFKGRLRAPQTQKEFIVNVKKAGTYDKDKKIIYPKVGS
ncbi:transcription initiation factor IIF subunit alpha [Phyllosticta citriasiana]|uniref:transcription initiation factor IIF subunit alpha n=1 Tax=Phyllosticta citriasiana TaxID=595635 RepID=UPI0030FD736C